MAIGLAGAGVANGEEPSKETPAAEPAPKAADQKEADDLPAPPPRDIFAAAKGGDLEAVKKFLADNPDLLNTKTKLWDTPLHWAVSCGHVEIVRFLLSKFPDVSAKNLTGSTPLHMACRTANRQIVELLLASKADVNAKAEEENDETPLHIAVHKGSTEIAELLLKHKADINAKLKENDWKPMDIAKQRGRAAMLRLLRKYGATDTEEE